MFWGQCVVEDSDTHRTLEVLVPRDDYEGIDNWHVHGLRGTGSNDVVVEDLFVPDEMTTAVAGRAP